MGLTERGKIFFLKSLIESITEESTHITYEKKSICFQQTLKVKT